MNTNRQHIVTTNTNAPPIKAMNDKQEADLKQLKNCLISVAKERDKRAFAYLFSWFAPKIKGIAIKQLGSEAQAMDVVQETMSKVWNKAHLFDKNKGAATTWVYTIMRNVSFDLLRKQQTRKEDHLSDELWPIVEAQSSDIDDDEYGDHIEKKLIANHIQLLPQAQQDIIKGLYFHELSQEQLAKQLGIPLGTVKSRLRLAMAKLKQQLGDNHD